MLSVSKNTIHAIEYALVIGGSFYLGMVIYPLISDRYEINAVQVKDFAPILLSASTNDFTLLGDQKKIIIKKGELKKWIETYTRDYSGKQDARLSYSIAGKYLASLTDMNSDPINAKLKFNNNKAEIFVPSSSGKKLDAYETFSNISTALLNGQSRASISFQIIEPDITLDKINNFGINTLLSQGTSDYGKSPSSRIHNIKVGMSKFNGIILKPGDEFSFNKFLGSVEAEDGFEAELVIKNGELIKEFGGGLCQVSTTIFRSAILAGLPITERKPHSFPVQYYNPQGFDSTIYPGVVDLKFVNDTPNHILIQTKVIGSKLTAEIYGSDDGRKVKITGPVQYDKKPSGALKAYFTREISLDGQLAKEERFDSVYKAPPEHPLERNPLE